MYVSILMAMAGALYTSPRADIAADVPVPPRQLMVSLTLCEGDPLGSVEAGTLKVLANPQLVTLESRQFSLVCGGERPVKLGSEMKFVRFGVEVEGQPGEIDGGKVPLDLTVSQTSEDESRDSEMVRFNTRSTRMMLNIKLGQPVRLRMGEGAARQEKWVELKVEEMPR